jgi:hypothetical protein
MEYIDEKPIEEGEKGSKRKPKSGTMKTHELSRYMLLWKIFEDYNDVLSASPIKED